MHFANRQIAAHGVSYSYNQTRKQRQGGSFMKSKIESIAIIAVMLFIFCGGAESVVNAVCVALGF